MIVSVPVLGADAEWKKLLFKWSFTHICFEGKHFHKILISKWICQLRFIHFQNISFYNSSCLTQLSSLALLDVSVCSFLCYKTAFNIFNWVAPGNPISDLLLTFHCISYAGLSAWFFIHYWWLHLKLLHQRLIFRLDKNHFSQLNSEMWEWRLWWVPYIFWKLSMKLLKVSVWSWVFYHNLSSIVVWKVSRLWIFREYLVKLQDIWSMSFICSDEKCSELEWCDRRESGRELREIC